MNSLYDEYLLQGTYIAARGNGKSKLCYDKFFGILGAQEEYNMVKIKKVIFNKPMTIVMWADGTKTMCKATKGTAFREEAGLAICFMKKAMGMTNTQFGKMVDKYKEEGTVVKKSSKKKKKEENK